MLLGYYIPCGITMIFLLFIRNASKFLKLLVLDIEQTFIYRLIMSDEAWSFTSKAILERVCRDFT